MWAGGCEQEAHQCHCMHADGSLRVYIYKYYKHLVYAYVAFFQKKKKRKKKVDIILYKYIPAWLRKHGLQILCCVLPNEVLQLKTNKWSKQKKHTKIWHNKHHDKTNIITRQDMYDHENKWLQTCVMTNLFDDKLARWTTKKLKNTKESRWGPTNLQNDV